MLSRSSLEKQARSSSQELPPENLYSNSDTPETLAPSVLFKKLSILDRLLSPFIIVFMVIGVIIAYPSVSIVSLLNFIPITQYDTVYRMLDALAIAIGLIVMMWPILTKVQYEALPRVFSTSRIWIHIGISMFLNWIIGPLVMLGLAWATLPDLPTYRTGVIMVGIARCIAMVMIWNELARGNADYCAILVVINSVLQIVLYSPYALLFINTIGGQHREDIHISYGNVAISVLIYLGIPLVTGVVTRYTVWYFKSKTFLQEQFIPFFSPVALLGLLYTILVMFAYQGHHIIHNLGPVFRVFVPMILYFLLMWTSAFAFVYYLTLREGGQVRRFGYQMAVVQSFTAGSNNFELAIAVAIAVYGVSSDQALAATIGPLVEVPVLLSLTWVALFLGRRLNWTNLAENHSV